MNGARATSHGQKTKERRDFFFHSQISIDTGPSRSSVGWPSAVEVTGLRLSLTQHRFSHRGTVVP
jgi:hypothetical protein